MEFEAMDTFLWLPKTRCKARTVCHNHGSIEKYELQMVVLREAGGNPNNIKQCLRYQEQ